MGEKDSTMAAAEIRRISHIGPDLNVSFVISTMSGFSRPAKRGEFASTQTDPTGLCRISSQEAICAHDQSTSTNLRWS
jgi:hypothetical protein